MKYSIVAFLLISISGFAQDVAAKRNNMLENRYATVQLQHALEEKSDAKVITGSKAVPLKDTISAIRAAEKILFKTYGKATIENQKPYRIQLIDNYWIIWGTFPADSLGGTFLIILDSRNSMILKMTHGK
jgi:hypothetical protein